MNIENEISIEIGYITSSLQRVWQCWSRHPPSYVNFWWHGHVTNVKPYICPSAIPMATKIGRVITYIERALWFYGHVTNEKSLYLHKFTWLFDHVVIWQITKPYISTIFLHYLHNIYDYQTLKVGRSHPISHVTSWLRGHVTNKKPYKSLSAIPRSFKFGRVLTWV